MHKRELEPQPHLLGCYHSSTSRVDNPWKVTWETHVGIWTVSCQARFRESLCDSSQVASDLRNSLSGHFWNVFLAFLYQHYISLHYPRNCKEFLREKTLAIHLRVRDCKPTIIYTIFLSFPLFLPLQLQILERFFSQTLTSPNLSAEWSFSGCGKHWKKLSIGGCNLELIVRSG